MSKNNFKEVAREKEIQPCFLRLGIAREIVFERIN
jgi:hypothetical protein